MILEVQVQEDAQSSRTTRSRTAPATIISAQHEDADELRGDPGRSSGRATVVRTMSAMSPPIAESSARCRDAARNLILRAEEQNRGEYERHR